MWLMDKCTSLIIKICFFESPLRETVRIHFLVYVTKLYILGSLTNISSSTQRGSAVCVMQCVQVVTTACVGAPSAVLLQIETGAAHWFRPTEAVAMG